MKWLDKLKNWGLKELKLNLHFAQLEFSFDENDSIAAWEMYVELITRITTQSLPIEHGDERAALNSVYSLFASTRDVLKHHGRSGQSFSKLAIIILNQVVRPFTAKWHKLPDYAFDDPDVCESFRKELDALQSVLSSYAGALADIAGVEDITRIVS